MVVFILFSNKHPTLVLNKEINKNTVCENNRRIWNSLVIVLVILELV